MNRYAALLALLAVPAGAAQFQAARPGAVAAPRTAPSVPGPLQSPSRPSQGPLPGLTNPPSGAPPTAAAAPASVLPSVRAASVPPAKTALETLGAMKGAAAERGGAAASVLYNAGGRQFDGVGINGTFYEPDARQMDLIVESLNRGSQKSRLVSDVLSEFTDARGNMLVRFAVDQDPNASYHAASFVDRTGARTVALTLDTIENGSWAFIMASVVRELMGLSKWYADVPASAERLALQYAHMAMAFAEATDSDKTAWSTNLDHNHRDEGTYFVWAWYEKLHEAVTSKAVGFVDSEFFSWLRDFVSKETQSNPSYQYSLYERLTREHYRPGSPLHGTPIPQNVAKLKQREHDVASARIYGKDGDADGNSDQNLLGLLRNWFSRRGNK